MSSSMICSPKECSSVEIKRNEMDGACVSMGRGEMRRGFDGGTLREKAALKT